eukprot:7204715-Pyramimonas_sp.AAC.1
MTNPYSLALDARPQDPNTQNPCASLGPWVPGTRWMTGLSVCRGVWGLGQGAGCATPFLGRLY